MRATGEATIYVVEDDPDLRDLVCETVRDMGLGAAPLGTAEEFFESYEPDEPGCVILDLKLPGMSGIELLERLEREDRSIPAIAITGSSEAATVLETIRAGAIDCLLKPFDSARLRTLIRSALDRAAKERERRAFVAQVGEKLGTLSDGEMDVVEELLRGRANKQIASFLRISCRTVESRRARIMRKMKCVSLPDLVTEVILYRELKKDR